NADTTGRFERAYVAAQQAQAAEEARKAIAHSMYWTFVALLIGAFCASLAATFGGKERDRVVVLGRSDRKGRTMRSILLVLLGVPIPIIILIGLLSRF